MRWANIVVTSTIVGVITAFCLLFMDPIIKSQAIKALQKSAKAKVELKTFKTKIFQGKVTLEGLQIADKNNPMTNLAEIEKAEFQLLTAPLFEKKIVIKEAGITGLTWGSQRKTSGELPKKREKQEKKKEPGPVEKKIKERLKAEQIDLKELDNIKKKFNPDEIVRPDKLASLEVIKKGNSKLDDLKGTWQKRVKDGDYEARISNISDKINAIKQEKFDIKKISKQSKKFKAIKKDIDSLKKDISSEKKSAKSDFNEVSTLMDEAKKAKAQDLETLSMIAGIPSMSKKDIATMLLGPIVMSKAEKYMKWAGLAKQYAGTVAGMGHKKPKKKREGIDIEFPKEHHYPTFLLMHAGISGFAPMQKDEPLNFSGDLTGASSSPKLYKEPIELKLAGANSKQALKVNIVIDRRTAASNDTVDIEFKGVDLSNIKLGNEDKFGALIEEGNGNVTVEAKRISRAWKGSVTLKAEPVKLEPTVEVSGYAGTAISKAIRNIKDFMASVVFVKNEEEGEDGIYFGLISDIGHTIGNAMKQMFSSEIASQKRAIRQKIDAAYNEKAASLKSRMSEERSGVMGKFGKYEEKAKKLLAKALSKQKGSAQPSLDKAKDKLKNLFK
ncbi:TIGR03545 family protein [Elusimicrobiota bacterium]